MTNLPERHLRLVGDDERAPVVPLSARVMSRLRRYRTAYGLGTAAAVVGGVVAFGALSPSQPEKAADCFTFQIPGPNNNGQYPGGQKIIDDAFEAHHLDTPPSDLQAGNALAAQAPYAGLNFQVEITPNGDAIPSSIAQVPQGATTCPDFTPDVAGGVHSPRG